MNRLLPIVLLLFFPFASGAVMAQAMPEQAQAEQEREAEEDRVFGELSEEDVEAFARAQLEVRELERDFAQQLRNREEGDDPAEMQQEMTQKRLELIEDAGLSSEMYRRILGAMARNEALRDHVEALQAEYRND